MGSVTKRVYESGTVRYRVQLKKNQKGSFSITFDDYEAACDWLEEHEPKFRADPEKYFKWRDSLANKYRRQKQRIVDHIVLPRLK